MWWIDLNKDKNKESSEFNLGEHCVFCKAKTHCPKFKEYYMEIQKIDNVKQSI